MPNQPRTVLIRPHVALQQEPPDHRDGDDGGDHRHVEAEPEHRAEPGDAAVQRDRRGQGDDQGQRHADERRSTPCCAAALQEGRVGQRLGVVVQPDDVDRERVSQVARPGCR